MSSSEQFNSKDYQGKTDRQVNDSEFFASLGCFTIVGALFLYFGLHFFIKIISSLLGI